MCGIAGKISFKNFDENEIKVEAACMSMINRGPDFQKIIKTGKAVLGHCRLAIIDLSAEANQPFFSEDKRYAIVFNGEIYNFNEVKKYLEQSYNLTFLTKSDTEVLLKGYIVLGTEILKHLRGMWAFAIWDNIKEELFVSRDRFGEKPFFYCFENDSFSFASNLSGITKLVENNEINPNAVSELYAYQYISQNNCIYTNIKKLLPAQFAIINKNEMKINSYWEVSYSEKIDISFEKAQVTIEEILHSSVKEKLVSDVPLGLFLSGGNDSGLVAAIASQYKKNITSITMSTPHNTELDESIYAQKIASIYNLNYKQIDIDINCINILPNLLQMIEPFADSSIIPTIAVSQIARNHLTVVLTGDGGDEIFGGYGIPTIFKQIKRSSLPFKTIIEYLSNLRFQPGTKYLSKIANTERLIKYGGIYSYCNSMDYEPSNIRKYLFRKNFIDNLYNEQAHFQKSIIRKVENKGFTDHDLMLYLGVKGYLADDFLMKVDSGTMFASLESRAPFLDNRLIEFTSKLKPEILMPDGKEKFLLKKICEKYLPNEIIYKKKTGFRIPVRDYFNSTWSDLLIKFIKEGISYELGITNIEGSIKLIEWYKKAKPSQMEKLLFSMLIFEIWLRVFHLKYENTNIKL
ncbi:MAG: asparagine synthase (glutamine-hydrolyzing) [Bacteroidetes bacterium]|nr:asparagine synthase (glutamine-hydrolyzing) [Bacteroidota bacterium]